MGILNEYEEVLIGKRKKVSPGYFMFDRAGNERVALHVIHYALEEMLGWDRETAIRMFNARYIPFMHLGQMMKYIVFPSDVSHDDSDYVLYRLYPRQVNYDVKKYTIRVYEKVLNNEMRYPKDYMYGYLGMIRARICLQYALNRDRVFKSPDDLYRFFSSKESVRYLKSRKLYQLYNSFYESPLEYMHDSMPSSVKNGFLYQNYLFLQKYSAAEKAARESRVLPEKKQGQDSCALA